MAEKESGEESRSVAEKMIQTINLQVGKHVIFAVIDNLICPYHGLLHVDPHLLAQQLVFLLRWQLVVASIS